MNENQIEQFLRENKPQVKDNPTFLLDTQQKKRQVEGLKTEVDRQRGYGRRVVIVTLIVGMFVGAIAMAIAYLYPVNHSTMGEGLWGSVRIFLDAWKAYLMMPVAVCAIVLGIIFGLGKRQDVRL